MFCINLIHKINPLNHVKIPQNIGQAIAIDSWYKVNEYSFNPNMYEIIKRDAIDLYPYLRDSYNQKRTILRKILLTLLLSIFCFANEGNFPEDLENEFKPTNSVVFDPLSGYNRVMTVFNDSFYTYVLTPTSKGYAYVVPETARIGIDNFFTNFFIHRFSDN